VKFAVTWANFQKFAHLWANENFIRPKLCHSPTQNPFAHINMKFAHFMGGKMLMTSLLVLRHYEHVFLFSFYVICT